MSETRNITTPIIKALEQMGWLVFRMNSGKLRVRGGYVHMAKKGTADILCFGDDGIAVWIETKDPAGATAKEQRDAQSEFKGEVMALGHKYICATCLDDVLAFLSQQQRYLGEMKEQP